MKNNAMAIGVRTRIIYGALAIMTILLSMGENTMAQTKSTPVVKNIDLVTGALVDGSGGEALYSALKNGGHRVPTGPIPTNSLASAVSHIKSESPSYNRSRLPV